MVTTIQISESAKNFLDRLKTKKETYEQVIIKAVRTLEEQKRKQEQLLIEGCKEMAEENLKITKEFEAIENLEDWEWE